MKNTLIVRYSRIGDALLVLPLVETLAESYPQEQFTVLTNSRFQDLIDLMSSNVRFIPMPSRFSKGLFRGIDFIIRRHLFLSSLKKRMEAFDQVVFFQYGGFEKKLHRFIQIKHPRVKVVISDDSPFWHPKRLENKCDDGVSMIGIYQRTLSELDYRNLVIETDFSNTFQHRPLPPQTVDQLGLDLTKTFIAFSPFSKESSKIYPLEKMEVVIEHFSRLSDQYQVIILGGGPREKDHAEKWAAKHPAVISLVDRVPFVEESVIISQCKVILAMDSFNMHLAFFLHVPVVSIWGPTAPQNGYYPPYHSTENAIIRNLDCQPCSMYGENQCSRHIKFECLDIAPAQVIRKIEYILKKK